MRHLALLLVALFVLGAGCNSSEEIAAVDQSEEGKPQLEELTIAFYNVENLFDTVDDPKTFDEEFTPEGRKNWTLERYQDKLTKLSSVLSQLDDELPDLIGLCEIENRKVLEDLIATPELVQGNYGIVHRDSPDGRGIDCALLFRMDEVMIGKTDFFTRPLPAGDRPNTREVVYAEVIAGGDTLHTMVNHWPSRGGGQKETEPNRLTIANMVKDRMDAIKTNDPDAKILLMGDFNDYPQNKSIREVLQASSKTDWPMYNLMESFDKAGKGTYNYKGDWGTLDQFIISNSLLYSTKGFSATENAAEIFYRKFLLYRAPDGNMSPSRTYGKEYYGGYSDHLAIFCRLSIK